MEFQGALIQGEGVTFAVAVVEENGIFYNSEEYIETIRQKFVPYFPNVPIVLISSDRKGRPVYNGKTELTLFLAGLDFRNINWQRYTMSEPA